MATRPENESERKKISDSLEIADRASDQLVRSVGFKLREARIALGLTQSQLGVKAGLKQSSITEFETGGANITLRTLVRMARVLDIDVRDLLPETKSSEPSADSINMLCSVLTRIADLLTERAARDASRLTQDADLLSELKAFDQLRLSLLDNAKPSRFNEKDISDGNAPS